MEIKASDSNMSIALTWVFRALVLSVIPFFVWINDSINRLDKSVSLIEQHISDASISRNNQIASIIDIVKDHESRIRSLENIIGHHS